jgi:glycosyltransferase involved in cell wall biosynthesis
VNPGSAGVEISAVMPAFNEQDNLERSVSRLDEVLSTVATRYEIIVVDDGSRDQTSQVLVRMKASIPALQVVSHAVNQGYGAAVRSGFSAARFGWVFLMDADNQFDPKDITLLLDRADRADIVTGYRLKREDPLLRRLNAWSFFTLVRLLFGRLARDPNCAFKLIRGDLLKGMELTSNGALINTELFVRARKLGARVVEMPVRHFPRTSGKQTGANPRVVLRAFRELLAFRARVKAGR